MRFDDTMHVYKSKSLFEYVHLYDWKDLYSADFATYSAKEAFLMSIYGKMNKEMDQLTI